MSIRTESCTFTNSTCTRTSACGSSAAGDRTQPSADHRASARFRSPSRDAAGSPLRPEDRLDLVGPVADGLHRVPQAVAVLLHQLRLLLGPALAGRLVCLDHPGGP